MNAVASAVPTVRSIDQIDRDIVGLTARINAVTCELLGLLREFDERAGWVKWSFSNCAGWLHWRCDISLGAAREKVRVAHAIKMLLCTQHHRLVHEVGFRIDKDYQDNWFFRRTDGRAVPACGFRKDDIKDEAIDAGPATEVREPARSKSPAIC
jgi:hypothetical protein